MTGFCSRLSRIGLVAERFFLALLFLFSATMAANGATGNQEGQQRQANREKNDAVEPDIDGREESTAQKELTDILQLNIDFGRMHEEAALRAKGQFVTDQQFDLNDDGIADLAFQSKFEHGGKSTHFVVQQAIGLSGTRLLRGGQPIAIGDNITADDLLNNVEVVPLCTVGGSLSDEFRDTPPHVFCSGSWWNKQNVAMAVAIPKNGNVLVGYIVLSCDEQGAVNAGKPVLAKTLSELLRIEADVDPADR